MKPIMNKRVRPRKALGEEVYRAIKAAILSGELEPGQRLIEEQLADSLGASRTPVRQAIHMLARENLAERQGRGGFIVRELSHRDIEEILDLRVALESFAARLAVRNLAPKELDALERKNEAFRAVIQERNLERLAALNTDFHDSLYALAENRRLGRMINDLHDHFYRYRLRLLALKEMAETSYKDHAEMIAAMRTGDPEQTESLVRAHILKGKKTILDQIREGKMRF